MECTGEGAVAVSRSTTEFDFTGTGRHWQLVYDVWVKSGGSYQITCTSADPGLTEPRFALGTAVDVGGILGKTFGSLGALLGIPCLALLAGGVIALVTGLRRSSYRKRLQQERYGYPAAGHPPGPPP